MNKQVLPNPGVLRREAQRLEQAAQSVLENQTHRRIRTLAELDGKTVDAGGVVKRDDSVFIRFTDGTYLQLVVWLSPYDADKEIEIGPGATEGELRELGFLDQTTVDDMRARRKRAKDLRAQADDIENFHLLKSRLRYESEQE